MSVIVPQIIFVGRLAFVRADTRGAVFGALGSMRFMPYANYANPAGDPIAGYLTPYDNRNPSIACQRWPQLPTCDGPPSGQTAAGMLQAMINAGYVAMIKATTPPGRSTDIVYSRNPATVEQLCNPKKPSSGLAIFDGPAGVIQQAQAIAAGVAPSTPAPQVPPAPAIASCAPGQVGVPPQCYAVPAPPPAVASTCPAGQVGIPPYCSGIPGVPQPAGVPALPASWPTIPGFTVPGQAQPPAVPGGGCPQGTVGLPPYCYEVPKNVGQTALVSAQGPAAADGQDPPTGLTQATGGQQQPAAQAQAAASEDPAMRYLVPALAVGGGVLVLLVLLKR